MSETFTCPTYMDAAGIESRFELLRERMDEAGEYEVSYLKELKYRDFLNTEYWRSVREYRLYAAGFVCERCGETHGLEVHHKTYEHRGQEYAYLQDLMVLCDSCHEREHRRYRRVSDLVRIPLLQKLPPVLAILLGERK